MTMSGYTTMLKPYAWEQSLTAMRKNLAVHALFFEYACETALLAALTALFAAAAYRHAAVFSLFQQIPVIALQGL